ncbi:tetratricopeptide repeat protein [Duganella sp. FT50W]|uniref:Tetratricopeptide repeat protein n=1 Tax=Duganella lactea TaxID=2692173 RepID=A0A6L8MHG7_9BURK|nr:tetratricopeptide repeat protein [Duganella lactea]MYM82373.1 tetratricopeptide repeat protein [Duganella lactea]
MELTSLPLPPLSSGGEVITFYSYKGGSGRTMALSNIAVLLARQQNASVPVLMIDWDLEAPGLHHYFDHAHEHQPGVLEFFEACHEQLRRRRDGAVALDDEALAHEVLAAVGWEQYVSRVDEASQLYLMRAGRLDETFPERLAALQWESLFHSCPALFRCFAERMARHFRYVLVDSRTGRTDVAGICTTLLPRKLVLVFTPNRQSLEGVQAVIQRATTYRRSHEDEQRPLMVYPLPSRMEMDDSVQRAQWRRGDPAQQIAGYQSGFEDVLRESYGMQQISLESYFDEVQLQQTRALAYGEQVAVRQDQGDGDRFSLTRTFEALLAWLAPGYFPWQSLGEIRLQASIGKARRALEEGGAAARAVSPPLARDLNALGALYRGEGRLRQALTCFEESLSLRQRGLGEDHPDTLVSKINLADTLRWQGRLDEAQFLDEAIVEARQRMLGAEHIDTLRARADLAATLGLQGRLSEALPLQDSVLDTCLRVLGADHPLTLSARAARAHLLLQRREAELARAAQEQVLAARKRLLGAEHVDTLHAKTALAHTLLQMQELGLARNLLDAVLKANLRRLGPDHAHTREAREQLIDVQLQLGVPADEAPLVPELHQDAAMDDYGDALPRSSRRHGASANSPWSRKTDDLLALDGHPSAPRNPPR